METSTTEFKYLKLRAKIKEVYGTEGRFADALHTSRNSVSRRFNDRTEFSKSDMEMWCSMLGIPLEESGKYFFA